MSISLSKHQRAQILIALLGVGLAFALWPYATGLIGAPVLAVICRPSFVWLARKIPPSIAAGLVVALTVFLLLVPGLSLAALAISEAEEMAGGIRQSPVLGELRTWSLGGFAIGQRLVTLGENAGQWIGTGAFSLIGTATKFALNMTIAMFGLYFLLLTSGEAWETVSPYIPFSDKNTEKLRERFRDVTNSTVIGTGLTALVQGLLVGLAFKVFGLPSPFFWGVITAVLSVLPVVGSGLVWGPGVVALILSQRYFAGTALLLWGLVVVASTDNVLRPLVYKKWARIHPLVTIVGALAGIRFFGVLGLLIGPLALSYFFELIVMYKDEYIAKEDYIPYGAL